MRFFRLSQKVLWTCVWFAASVGGGVAAAEYYVSPSGDDTQAGTKATPWKTISRAAAYRRLRAGDTIWLKQGEYDDDVLCAASATDGKHITIAGTAGARVVIRGSIALGGSHLRLENVEVRPRTGDVKAWTLVYLKGPYCKMVNCTVSGTGDRCAVAAGVRAEVYGCVFRPGGGPQPAADAVDWILPVGSEIAIENNIVLGPPGLRLWGGAGRRQVLRKNIVMVLGGRSGAGILIGKGNSGALIEGNVVYAASGNEAAEAAIAVWGPDCGGCILKGNWLLAQSGTPGAAMGIWMRGDITVGCDVSDNYVCGFGESVRIENVPVPPYTFSFERNQYLSSSPALFEFTGNQLRFRGGFSAWQAATGFDGTSRAGGTGKRQVFLFRNRYDAKRFLLAIYRPGDGTVPPVKLELPMAPGRQYKLHNVENLDKEVWSGDPRQGVPLAGDVHPRREFNVYVLTAADR